MRFSTLNDWLTWQETLHPQEIDLGLERIAVVWQRMAADLGEAKVITVAGTNGKGSCVAMLESIYLAAGYRTGAYTSPHLLRYNERIRINGQTVSDERLCLAFEQVDQARADISLSYFEFGTLAALLLFSQAGLSAQGLDIVLLEVGLGGRLDAVNIIDADVALISSIAIDHSDWLGLDRDSIGIEKAGIFRRDQVAVCGDPQPPASILEQARQRGTQLYCLGRDFHILSAAQDSQRWSWSGQTGLIRPEQAKPEPVTPRRYDDLPWPQLEGLVQLNNAASVIQALVLLESELPLGIAALQQGLRQVNLPGRYQRFYCRTPGLQACKKDDKGAIAVIVDVAHNPAAAKALAQTLTDNSIGGQTRAVIGMLSDKDVAGFLSALKGVVDHWYVSEPLVARACPATELMAALAEISDSSRYTSITAWANIDEAAQQALLESAKDDRLLVLGSFYTVADFIAAMS